MESLTCGFRASRGGQVFDKRGHNRGEGSLLMSAEDNSERYKIILTSSRIETTLIKSEYK